MMKLFMIVRLKTANETLSFFSELSKVGPNFMRIFDLIISPVFGRFLLGIHNSQTVPQRV